MSIIKTTKDYLKEFNGEEVEKTIVDNMEYAIESKNMIKDAIAQKNSDINDETPFREYAQKINNLNNEDWKPEPDWWDIDRILEEDTEDYPGKMIALLSDSFPTETINRLNADKIVTSDGKVYTDTSQNIQHTWDTTKDKTCHYGYKTRYVIWYFSETNVALNYRLPDETMYMIMKNLNYTTNYPNTLNSLYNCRGMQSLKFIDCSCLNKGVLYDFVNCCLSNLQGLKYQNSIAPEGLRRVASICIYNSKIAKSLFNELYSSLETKKPTSARELFRDVSINYIPFFDTSECSDFFFAFASTGALRSIENIDFNSATSVDRTFSSAVGLININSISNIKISGLNFSSCLLLSYDTLIKILNALYDYSAVEETYILTLGSTNVSKLTEEEIAAATEKGWTIS